MEDKYKRLTAAQVELWLASPATKAYLICLGLEMEKVEGQLEEGRWIDPTNNDLTSWNLSYHRAKIEAYDFAMDAEALLHEKEMIEIKEDEDEAA